MKIIVRKSDGVVLYAVNAVLQIRDDAIVCDNVIIGDHGALTADVVEADAPADFLGGRYKLVNGEWQTNPEYVAPTPPEPLPVAPSA